MFAAAGAVSNVRVSVLKLVSLNANFIERYCASPFALYHFNARSRLKETLPPSGNTNASSVVVVSSAFTEAEFSAVKIREGVAVAAADALPPSSISTPPKTAEPSAAASRRVMILDLYFFIKAMPRNFCKLLPFTILCFLYFTPKRDESQTHFTVK